VEQSSALFRRLMLRSWTTARLLLALFSNGLRNSASAGPWFGATSVCSAPSGKLYLSPIPEMWATLSLLTWHSNITFLSSSGQNSKLVIHIGPNGENDGKNQVFLTPGLIVGRIPLFWRFKALIGVGYQFAASDVHPSYQSNWILTMRLPF
jgi:hypothetical protein